MAETSAKHWAGLLAAEDNALPTRVIGGLLGLYDAARNYDYPDTAAGWGRLAAKVPGAIYGGLNTQAKDAIQQGTVAAAGGPSDKITETALGLLGAGAFPMGAPANSMRMINWHGGPNVWVPEPGFPHGRPRLDKMGTGEGAQAYGHGFYSAEAYEVGKGYKDRLADPNNIRPLPEIQDKYKPEWDSLVEKLRPLHEELLTPMSDKRAIMEKMAPLQDAQEALSQKMIDESIEKMGKGGAIYKLDIPDEDVAKYLDWDAPLSEQPGALTALRKYWDETLGDPDIIQERLGITDKSTGQDLYNALQGVRQGGQDAQKAASEALRKAGIPGLKYYDGMSRGKGEGSRNYVTWDQDVLDRTKVLERNGVGLLNK